MSIKNLEPNGLWKNFYNLTQIPRPSKKEAKVVAFVKEFGVHAPCSEKMSR